MWCMGACPCLFECTTNYKGKVNDFDIIIPLSNLFIDLFSLCATQNGLSKILRDFFRQQLFKMNDRGYLILVKFAWTKLIVTLFFLENYVKEIESCV